jgi:hypothetical protein
MNFAADRQKSAAAARREVDVKAGQLPLFVGVEAGRPR